MSELKIVGIDEKGYGKVYKAVMRNPLIPLTAKAIYAYFCSYAGSGTTAFPHRDKVICELQISKNTFTRHLNFLIEAGYIARQRTVRGNVYEILTAIPDKDGETFEAKSQGYGTIPKLAMLDGRLTANAKAIYAYLCSYAGGGHVAYPHRTTIFRELGIGRDAYYPHYKALIETGYLTPVQKTSEDGRFTACDYLLNEEIGVAPSGTANKASSPKAGSGKKVFNRVFNGNSQISVHGRRPKSEDTVHGEGAAISTDITSETGCCEQNSALQSDSPKSVHGELTPHSQKPVHGEDAVFHRFFNSDSQKSVHGGIAMSQKTVYRKTAYGNLGHANTNNSFYNKHSSAISIAEENITNPRAHAHARAGNEDALRCSPRKEAKEFMGYDFLLAECTAWAGLKKMLGHFPDTGAGSAEAAELAYTGHIKDVLDELACHVQDVLGGRGDTVEHCGRVYNRAALRQTLMKKFADSEAVLEAVVEVADKGSEIKNLRGYMKALVFNLAEAG